MLQLLSIGIGGFFGAITRYLVSKGITRYFKSDFPLGTLTVNLVGCFVLGFIMTMALKKEFINPLLRTAITTGFIGALTTFSTFTYETLALVEGKNTVFAFANILISVAFGLLFGWLGIATAKTL